MNNITIMYSVFGFIYRNVKEGSVKVFQSERILWYLLVAWTNKFIRTSLQACDAHKQIVRGTKRARWTACHLSLTWRTVQRRVCPTYTKLSCEMEIEIMRTYFVNWCMIIQNQDGDALFMLNTQRSKLSYNWHNKI